MGIAYIRYIQQAPEIARSQTMQRANGQRWLSKTISNTTCKADSCLKYLNHHELCSSAAGQEICSGLQFCENPCSWIRYTDRALGQWDWWAGARWPMGDGCVLCHLWRSQQTRLSLSAGEREGVSEERGGRPELRDQAWLHRATTQIWETFMSTFWIKCGVHRIVQGIRVAGGLIW